MSYAPEQLTSAEGSAWLALSCFSVQFRRYPTPRLQSLIHVQFGPPTGLNARHSQGDTDM